MASADVQATAIALALIASARPDGALVRYGGRLLRSPAEAQRMDRLTRGRAIIMGLRTFQALSFLPPDRWFLVLTRDEDLLAEGGVRYLSGHGYWYMPDIAAALHSARVLSERASAPEFFVVGGAGLLQEALPLARRVYLTTIPEADVVEGTTMATRDSAGWRVLHAERPVHGVQFEVMERTPASL